MSGTDFGTADRGVNTSEEDLHGTYILMRVEGIRS